MSCDSCGNGTEQARHAAQTRGAITAASCWLPGILAVACCAAWCGCTSESSTSLRSRVQVSDQPSQEHLDIALDYLERLDEFQEQQARVQAAYQLNRWIETRKTSSEWQPDELVNRVPRVARDRGALEDLARRSFSVDDIRFLQESVWMRQLSNWISRKPLPDAFARWLEARSATLGPRETEQLGVAFRLFDWTIRNIQLKELPPNPDEAAVAPQAGADVQQAREPASVRGLPGPGYQEDPAQTLLYGQGDAWQRMRVFTLLARQQGLDVVVLAFPGRSNPPRPRPWASALLLKNQLYLFDARLGLPIPGPALEGVATLEEVLDDPALLQTLTFDEQHPYAVDKQDMGEIAALLDVVSPNLSLRMQMLETQLTGEHRTSLAVPLTPLANRLRKCRGIYDVYIWSIPFEALWYREGYQKRMLEDEFLAAYHLMQYGMFLDHSPLVRARYRYFRGDMDSEGEEGGAKTLLMEARVPQEQIELLATNEDVQRQFGLVRTERDTDPIWQARLESVRRMMLTTKQHVTFWLGLLQLESARHESAIVWLKTRSLEVWPDGVWAAAGRYNLARAYEAEGKLSEAQQVLLSDKSPQEHGNYLRARMLQKQLETRKTGN